MENQEHLDAPLSATMGKILVCLVMNSRFSSVIAQQVLCPYRLCRKPFYNVVLSGSPMS